MDEHDKLTLIYQGETKFKFGALFRYPDIDERLDAVKRFLDLGPRPGEEIATTVAYRKEFREDLEERVLNYYNCDFQTYIENYWRVNEYFTPPPHYDMTTVPTDSPRRKLYRPWNNGVRINQNPKPKRCKND